MIIFYIYIYVYDYILDLVLTNDRSVISSVGVELLVDKGDHSSLNFELNYFN